MYIDFLFFIYLEDLENGSTTIVLFDRVISQHFGKTAKKLMKSVMNLSILYFLYFLYVILLKQ